jgi:UDP-glucose 4-epimerase
MKNIKVIVTGGAGFIGSHLVELLVKKKFKVIVIDNFITGRKENLKKIENKIKIVNANVNNFKIIEKYFKDCAYVFHLSALADIVPSIEKPDLYFDYNVVGTLNVLRAAKKYNVKKFIYTASSSCYGLVKQFPTNENCKIDNQHPYALTKYLGEQLVMSWSKIYKLNAISLRLFNVYGVRSRTTGAYGAMFGVFLAQKINEKPLTIVGDGSQSRDFTYVTDVAKAFLKAATSNIKCDIFNVGTGTATSVNYVAKKIGGKITFIPKRPGEPDKTQSDIKKIKKFLKWKPQVSINQGIDIMIKNINDWKQAPVWTPNKIKNKTKVWFKFLK